MRRPACVHTISALLRAPNILSLALRNINFSMLADLLGELLKDTEERYCDWHGFAAKNRPSPEQEHLLTIREKYLSWLAMAAFAEMTIMLLDNSFQ